MEIKEICSGRVIITSEDESYVPSHYFHNADLIVTKLEIGGYIITKDRYKKYKLNDIIDSKTLEKEITKATLREIRIRDGNI